MIFIGTGTFKHKMSMLNQETLLHIDSVNLFRCLKSTFFIILECFIQNVVLKYSRANDTLLKMVVLKLLLQGIGKHVIELFNSAIF